MELALTVLLWIVVAAVGAAVLLAIIAGVIGVITANKANKEVKKEFDIFSDRANVRRNHLP